MVVLGAGVLPATSFITPSQSINIDPRDNSIIVDQFLFTGADGLWAAGDLAKYPFAILNGKLVRIEHWGMAQTQAAIAAKNMVKGCQEPIDTKIPYFWTEQYGKNIRCCGYAPNYDEVVFDRLNGDVSSKDFGFVAYYIYEDIVIAACSLGRDPVVAQVAEILNAGIQLSGSEIKTAITVEGNANQLIKSKLNTSLIHLE